jgi:hypothetical protein
MTCWKSRYAAGANDMAVPGWPVPGLLNGIGTQDANGVDGPDVKVGPSRLLRHRSRQIRAALGERIGA